nr:uncharacterized protein LOC117853999 isoform X2 [Setaria viridis]
MGTAPITIAVRPRLDLRRVCCPAILDPSRFAPRVLSSDPGTEARVGTAWLRLDSQLGCQLHARSFRKRLAPQMEARILLGSLRHALSIRPPPETILGKKKSPLPPSPSSTAVVFRRLPLAAPAAVLRRSPLVAPTTLELGGRPRLPPSSNSLHRGGKECVACGRRSHWQEIISSRCRFEQYWFPQGYDAIICFCDF